MFKVLRNGLLRYILYMPKPNVTRVQSATEWTASVHTLHMPKPNVTRVQSATECPMVDAAECSMQIQNFELRQRNAKSCASTDASNAQTCDKVRVQSGTQWCTSAIHMPKCVVTIVFKRLRHGVVRSILYICPNHATPCCNLFVIHAFILCHSWFVFDVH